MAHRKEKNTRIACFRQPYRVARFGSGWGCCSFLSYFYRDATLAGWLQQFSKRMKTPEKLEELREQFLAPKEIESKRRLDKTRWD